MQTGKSPGKPRDEHGHHDDFFGGFLKDGGFGLETRAVLDGDLPQDTCHADGRLVTGSGFGAHEEHDWIPGFQRRRAAHPESSFKIHQPWKGTEANEFALWLKWPKRYQP
ncbi:MAG: hypothetical protein F4Z52_08020 [Gammaproteobacteria bacterium]|nr:hypothetical protein [Gammaproteobacteria bacterium]